MADGALNSKKFASPEWHLANGYLDKEQPLAGVVLCFTSILPEERSKLAEVAGQMGAIHKFDLTSDVTHLLVGETNTEKYKFVARERSDVLVLLPKWIEAVREAWMEGGDIDLKVLEEKYRLPTFHGLSICVTGFDDISYRNYLQETTIANGAEFRKDLTKNVTHLIAQEPSGQKYKFATQWKIKVVTGKWFSDSLERGMILDETRYDPLLSAEEQGVGAWNRSNSAASSKREKPTDFANTRTRKLRRVASSKLGNQNEGIWGDIMGGGFETTESNLSISISSKAGDNASGEETQPNPKDENLGHGNSLNQESTPPFAEQPLKEMNGFLQNCYFFIHGFSSKQVDVLRHHLTMNGAQLVNHLNDFSSHKFPKTDEGLYIITSHKIPRSEVPSTDDMAFRCEIVTDLWLERCLDSRALVSPEAHVTSTPFPKLPIFGFEGMKICSTGFTGLDLLHLSRLVNATGAKYEEFLTSNISVLICNDQRNVNAEKLRHTLEWNIPAVSADWLWISVNSGQKKAFEPYLVQKLVSQNEAAPKERDLPRPQRHSNETRPRVTDKTEGLRPKQNSSDEYTEQSRSRTHGVEDSFEQLQTNGKPDGSVSSRSVSPTKREDGFTPAPTEPLTRDIQEQSTSSRNPSKALEAAMNGFLKQAREFSRTNSASGDKNPRKRRPNLGRTNSLSSTKNGLLRANSRASSIDTLNEDGYGSAVSAETDGKSSVTSKSKLPANIRTQSFASLSTGSRFTGYIDSPYDENNNDLMGNDETPAMTQLNYEDPDAMAAREEIMRLASRGNVDESRIVEKMSHKPSANAAAAVVVNELPSVPAMDHTTGRGVGTTRRSRRSAGKQKEADNNIF
ncbi:DNA topoisomerase 2-binding protein 1-A [Talaromyces islandicus]|uniref:DNA topoisomerase 2-binding protein 1-A n=1 Tax=Talaromyces islandicus TaxID=28573 RepID=A0A0U1LMY3_TALIS|nr:DNA topoisomerase 2-binding protein 1-A [Talaromyces islandicus]